MSLTFSASAFLRIIIISNYLQAAIIYHPPCEMHFEVVFLSAWKKGISLGVIEDEKLIGFALLFDYKATKNTHRGAFNEIFGIHDDQPLPYYEEIHQKIESIDGKILYLLSIAVSPAYRRCGIASALIDYVLSYYSECSIASDVSNEDSLEIYKKRNFEISKIEDGYFFISKKHR